MLSNIQANSTKRVKDKMNVIEKWLRIKIPIYSFIFTFKTI